MNSRQPVPGGLLEAEGPLEGSGPRTREHAQCGSVDPGRNGIAAIIATIGPHDRQLALDDDALGVDSLDQVERDRDLRPGRRVVAGRGETGVMPLGLDQAIAGIR